MWIRVFLLLISAIVIGVPLVGAFLFRLMKEVLTLALSAFGILLVLTPIVILVGAFSLFPVAKKRPAF